MGVHSSLEVSRQAALKALRKVVADDNIDDETVSLLINALLYPRLYNATVVADNEGSDDSALEREFD